MSEQFDKLAAKLSELFELEKADLDFGIHRIIKARQKHIRVFLGLEEPPAEDPDAPTLEKIVRREMGEVNTTELEGALNRVTEELRTAFGTRAFDASDQLVMEDAKASPDGQTWLSLREQLDSGTAEANEQLEASIYSHLTTFFSRYYDDADFISKRRIKAGAEPYAVPYSGEEVMLHWANKDQYYIKSSKDLKDYTFTLKDGKRVQFKCERQDPVLNNNNAKREFHLDDEAEIEATEDALVIPFHFKIVEKTRTQAQKKTWIEEVLSQLPIEWQDSLKKVPEGSTNNLLTRHLNNYTRKNEADFFIHKHLGKFLRGELDFYIKSEVMHLDDIAEKSADYLTAHVRIIKAIRTIAHHIIDFLAQLENFQKKLWLKKKYVTETQYCFTLDRILTTNKADALLTTILDHLDTKIRRYDGEMRSQHEEWIKLYAINELDGYPADKKLTADFLKAHDKLMLDTVFFPDSFKWQLLGEIDDLDDSLDGLIIHSENFQALNLLQERYREKVKCVYIDPPYNTGGDGFIYKDRYQHSSWCSQIQSLIHVTSPFLVNGGVLFSSIDDNEVTRLSQILELNFGSGNHVANLIWQKRYSPDIRKCISDAHEFILSYSNNAKEFKNNRRKLPLGEFQKKQFSNPDSDPRGPWKADNFTAQGYRPNQMYPITLPSGEVATPPEGRCWVYTEPKFKEFLNDDRMYFGQDGTGRPAVKRFLKDMDGMVPWTWWDHKQFGHSQDGLKELMSIFTRDPGFTLSDLAPKPTKLIAKIGHIALHPKEIALDYFAGSGTTAHAVINLNREDEGSRNYILVEMGDHFDTVLKPRIQKVVYSADWKDGKPTSPDTGISHGFKYLRLESYEDALNNLDLSEDRSADLLGLGDSVREDYLFSYLLDVETRGHLMNLDRFRDPWGCQLKIHDPHTGKCEPRTIDLVETFNYLIGITVREVKVRDGFLTLEGENPAGDTILILWRKLEGDSDWPTTTNADLKAFVTDKLRINPADTEYHALYLNGDHTLEDPHSKIHCTEEVFYDRMFAHTGNPDD